MLNPFKRPASITPSKFPIPNVTPAPVEDNVFGDNEKMLRITLIDEGDYTNVRTADNFGSNDNGTLEVLEYAAASMGLKVVVDNDPAIAGDVLEGVMYILVNDNPTGDGSVGVSFEDEEGYSIEDWNFKYDMMQACLSIMGYNLGSA